MAVAVAGNCSSSSAPSLGTSMCCWHGPKKQKKQKNKKQKNKKQNKTKQKKQKKQPNKKQNQTKNTLKQEFKFLGNTKTT